jgi:hypothetical protein
MYNILVIEGILPGFGVIVRGQRDVEHSCERDDVRTTDAFHFWIHIKSEIRWI